MKVLSVILIFAFFACDQVKPKPTQEKVEKSEIISADSLIFLAEKAIERFQRHRVSTADSMSGVIEMNSRLSRAEKAEIMQQVKDIESNCQQCYQQLKEAKERQVLLKDSVVFNIVKIDSFVKVPVIVYDTIIKKIEVNKRGKRKKNE